MQNIVKIIIEGSSGFCPADMAYEDKITITSESIRYEYKPLFPDSEFNVYRKWSYRTTSSEFQDIYHHIKEMTVHYLYKEECREATDVGVTSITAIFEDKHKERVQYACPSDYFKDYYNAIKLLVPPCEPLVGSLDA